MKILLLGPDRGGLAEFIRETGDTVDRTENPLGPGSRWLNGADMIVSYGYRHVLPSSTIAGVGGRAVNLHCSMLPWNRGAHPNFWSFVEGTPKGVSIHVIDDGIDTGPIIAQLAVTMGESETLRTSYEQLSRAVEGLFKTWWPLVREWRFVARAQAPEGSSHSVADIRAVEHLLSRGWDTPVASLSLLSVGTLRRSIEAKKGTGAGGRGNS